MKKRIGLLVLLSILTCFFRFTAAETVITTKTLLQEMVDLERLTRFPVPGYTYQQASSYERKSLTPSTTDWFANNDFGNYVREEKVNGHTEYVMLETDGPGAIVRIWSANPPDKGIIRIYLDDLEKPSIEYLMADFMRGSTNYFLPPPFSYRASFGYNVYFPFIYEKHCKVTLEAKDPKIYYHIGYRTYEKNTKVKRFTIDEFTSLAKDIDETKNIILHPSTVYQPTPNQQSQNFSLSSTNNTLTIKSSAGSIIRELCLIPSTTGQDILRSTILSIKFDGKETVTVPFGDFFGSGPGVNPYESLPSSITKEGVLTSRWPMPFKKSMEIQLRGTGINKLTVTGTVKYEPYTWDNNSLYFYAKWRIQNEIPTQPRTDWNYAILNGKGIYVGNVLNVTNYSKAWWGEGDEKIYVDGEPFPSTFGTGTEDYYGYAWCATRLFSQPYHNQTRCDGPSRYGHISVNRWHIFDPFPFNKSFRFDMEIWHWAINTVSYDTVNYWYATVDTKDNFPNLPDKSYLVPPVPAPKLYIVPDSIEGEEMKIVGSTESTRTIDLSVFGDHWSKDKVFWWWGPEKSTSTILTLSFNAPKPGKYNVIGYFVKGEVYAIYQFYINNEKSKKIDFYEPSSVTSGPIELGSFNLKDSDNHLTVEYAGINSLSDKSQIIFGLDCLQLKKSD